MMLKGPLQNERLLLQQVAESNEHAFAVLFDHYRPNLYTTALRITGSTWAAEEIVQDTFLKVWLHRQNLNGIENFTGWLFTIAENLTYNVFKRWQRERKQAIELTQQDLPLFQNNSDQVVQEKDYQSILHTAILRLPNKQRQTYKLIKQEGMKREDAANTLQVSPETVKWNLEQAMRSIRAFCMAHLENMSSILILFSFFANYF
jgi:RNA polymerase sigma-70 factor (ECF subfamily)